VGSNPHGGMDICLANVVCCQVEVSASQSLWYVVVCDLETSRKKQWPTGGCWANRKKKVTVVLNEQRSLFRFLT